MDLERTQVQTPADRVKSQDLSLRRTQPPAKVPGYDPERLLGEGAYGEVWVATERNTGRKVAVKFYTHRGGMDWSLLKREVEKLAFLSADRYVIQLIEVGWDSDPPYYVMEYLGHGSLEERLNEQGALPLDEGVGLFREVATGLMHAHGKGVLHCDLKPANVLLDQDSRPRLCDFGQARLSDEQTPSLGTLFYMAPVQANLKQAVPDARWDVYALGALFYCMLTGEPPYRSEQTVKRLEAADTLEERLSIYRQSIESAPRPTGHRKVPGVNKFLADIIDRCLAAKPDRRYSNVQALLTDLEDWQRRESRRPLLVLAVVLPVLLLALIAFSAQFAFKKAMRLAEDALRAKTTELHKLAATYAAPAVANKIDSRWAALIAEADELVGARRDPKGKTEPKTLKSAAVGEPPSPVVEQQRAYEELRDKAREAFHRWTMSKPDDAKASADELKVLQGALAWAATSLEKAYAGDPGADEKSIHAHVEAAINGDPGHLMGYADQTADKLESERRRTVLTDWLNLQRWIAALQKHYQERQGLATSSWFITNDRGDQLARHPLDIDTLFRNYNNRDYFLGKRKDAENETSEAPQPLRKPHLSQVYVSEATEHRTVAFSVPIKSIDRTSVLGVLAMSVEFGAFSELPNENKQIFTSLVDSRKDYLGRRGGLLEHPVLRELRRDHQPLPAYYLNDAFSESAYQLSKSAETPKREDAGEPPPMREAQLRFIETLDDYQDPVEEAIEGGPDDETRAAYQGPWLAAMMTPVILYTPSEGNQRTGWVVVVQEREANALAPVSELRRQLTVAGAITAAAFCLVVCAVWGLAYLTLKGHTRSKFVNAVRRRMGLTGGKATASTTSSSGRTARRQAKTATQRSATR